MVNSDMLGTGVVNEELQRTIANVVNTGNSTGDFWIKFAIFIGLTLLIVFTKKLIIGLVVKIFKKATTKTKTTIDDQILEVVHKPVELFYATFFIYLASFVLGAGPLVVGIFTKTAKSVLAFSVFWAVYMLADVVVTLLTKGYTKISSKQNKLMLQFFKNVYKVAVFVLGFIIIVQEWYNIGAILAGLSIGGLAFALAAKDTAANLFGSIVIILERTFDIGDFVETSSGSGTIEDIGFRSTKIRTLEEGVVTVPNAKMGNESIINWSKRGKRRIKFTIGLTYNTSTKQMNKVLEDIKKTLIDDEQVDNDSIYVVFTNFGDSALEILVQYFVLTADFREHLEIKERVNLEIMKVVNSNNASMAFPSVSVYMEK